MTPEAFISKWRSSSLKEKAGSQSHFNDLCALLGQQTPTDADPDGTWYTFEKGVSKLGGGEGYADVWMKGHFAWEYKGKDKNLDKAFKQLQLYAIGLENPPLLVVSDMDVIKVFTNFTNTPQQLHVYTLDDLAKPEVLQQLRWLFTDPERFRPAVTREKITEQAAEKFAHLAHSLRAKGHEAHQVAHYVNKLLFCMFAEDIEILPKGLFSRLLESGVKKPDQFPTMAKGLFSAMRTGGSFGTEIIDWFNGGLFDDDEVLPMDKAELELALTAARMDWADIEPSIFGTLFERGLDPSKRSQLGAHYTDRESIMRIVGPVVIDPLVAEWEEVKAKIETLIGKVKTAATKGAGRTHFNNASKLFEGFIRRLGEVQVLDPACGSGNFLYLSLLGLKDLEHRVNFEASQLGLQRGFPMIGPQSVMGIEINSYAAELARITVWIGQIQWMLRHGYGLDKHPILKNLNQIQNRDALINEDGSEAEWPASECIVGNPPFVGDKKMISELGEEYVMRLRKLYEGRVPGGADLVTYWFEKARAAIETGRSLRAGLVTTDSIRGGQNRRVLDRIREAGTIFNAVSKKPWVLEGASVSVSIVCFSRNAVTQPELDGTPVDEIFSDLTGKGAAEGMHVDMTKAKTLSENADVSFIGTQKNGAFDIPGAVAREWLKLPSNPNGRPNSDVVKPWANGLDLTRRPSDTWIVDFGVDTSEDDAALYEAPFEYIEKQVKEERQENRRAAYAKKWWLYAETRPKMRKTLAGLTRYIATPRVSKHRLFVWLDQRVLPDCAIVAIARDDETTFGILHSRYHEMWALRLGTSLEDRPRYTPSTTFETFPFPEGLSPSGAPADYASDPRAGAVADAARRLDELRNNWLNPPEYTNRVPEVVQGYPDRLIPVDAQAATELKKRTLTNLYNQKPQWLVTAHKRLDEAVASAYGWPTDVSDDDALARLLALNLARQAP